MKKLHLVLASLATATSFLLAPQAAWANESDDSQESSSALSESTKELENKEQEEAFFKTLLKVEPTAIDKGQDKIFESSKNWMYEAVDGKEPPKPTERPYKIPEDWKLQPSLTKDDRRDVGYRIMTPGMKGYVNLYTLEAYATSPLKGGKLITEKELQERIESDQEDALFQDKLEIDGKQFQARYEVEPNQGMACLVLYRLEDTGKEDDSVLVGALYFPLERDQDLETAISQQVANLKGILSQLSKDK